MSIISWNPFNELEDIRSEINKVFNDSAFSKRKGGSKDLSFWEPVSDIVEVKDGYKVRTEMPGIPKESIKISVSNDILTIEGEKKQETEEEKDAHYHRTERVYGSFQKMLSLPQEVAAYKITANYKNGVLEVFIPKGKKVKPKEIKVE
ncbi:MAG: Hsp20/alpha crystallin family protein [Spirochaetes bacterium]|nr:Hsp20/alpha crystallin family protein [Spirochaetota bacterium]